MGDATAGIALRVSGALKPHHHDKIDTSSLRIFGVRASYSASTYLSHITYMNNKSWEELIVYFPLIRHGPQRKRRL
jgi:hypothetical protein